ncbi:MAG: hypothetical protein J6T99_06340 [Oscillospiraceae bacterium]|nr:hypothetical protein [Oscillospiraceae bacterium]
MWYIYADGKLFFNPLNDEQVVIEPKCTLQMGAAGSAEFRLPMTNTMYDKLTELKTLITIEDGDDEIFRGRILTKEKDFNGFLSIYCEGNLSFLVDSVQKNEAYIGTAWNLFSKVINNHNEMVDESKQFQVGTITVEDRDMIISGQSDVIEHHETDKFDYKQIAINATTNDWANTYDYIQNNLIQYCGGYLRTRRQNGVTYIDWLANNYGETSQTIKFGVNLLDLNEHISAENIYTVLIPLGDENLTLEPLTGSRELVDTENVEKYGRIVRTHVFENVTEPETLMENAVRYMETEMKVPVTVTIKAVDMHMLNRSIEAIRVGDLVQIHSEPHGIVKEMVCIQIEYDLERPEQTSYTFGNPEQSLTQRYKKDKSKQAAASAANAASAAAGGGKGAKADADDDLEHLHAGLKAWAETEIEKGKTETQKTIKDALRTECEIDLDGTTGNVKIKSLRDVVTTHGDQIVQHTQQVANLITSQHDDHVTIEMNASRITDVDNEQKGHFATLGARADDLQSQIYGKADSYALEALDTNLANTNEVLQRCGIYMDGSQNNVNIRSLSGRVDTAEGAIAANRADLEVVSTGLSSQVSLTASHGSRLNAAEKNIAEIQVKADENSSQIVLKADEVVVEGKFTVVGARIDAVEEDIIQTKQLIANEINAVKGNVSWLESQNIKVVGVQAGSVYATSIYVGGTASKQEVATQKWCSDSFYTQSQIDYLLSNISPEHSHSVSVSSNGTVTLGGVSETGGSFRIADTKTYKDGVSAAIESVTVVNIRRTLPDEYDSTTHNTLVHLVANAKNGKSLESEIIVLGNSAYDSGYSDGYDSGETAGRADGIDSVNITSIRRSEQDTYDSSTHNTTVHVVANASNGKSGNQDLVVIGASAYDEGYQAGQDAGSQEAYENGYNNGYSVGYGAGEYAGEQSVTIDSLDRYEEDSYNSDTRMTTVYAQAVTSNGKTRLATFQTSGTKAYNAGKSAGQSSVTIDSMSASTSSYNSSGKNYTLTATATASNGAKLSKSFTVGASSAYNAGVNSVTPSTSYSIISKAASATSGSVKISIKATNGKAATITVPIRDCHN